MVVSGMLKKAKKACQDFRARKRAPCASTMTINVEKTQEKETMSTPNVHHDTRDNG
jgi:hypothetical protein